MTEEQIDAFVREAHEHVMDVVRVAKTQAVVDAAALAEFRRVFEAGREEEKRATEVWMEFQRVPKI